MTNLVSSRIKVAGIHTSPVYLDAAATADKAVAFIAEAAAAGAELVLFPESFIPGFPVWAALHAPIRTHEAFQAFAAASILIDGPEIRRIRQAAARHRVFVSLGFSESNPASVGGLWNSNVLIGDDGAILIHHRKLVPTFFEKLVWNPGDGEGLRVANTRIGRLGTLICGENTNPLARFSLIAQGEQIHIASYPPVWPTRPPSDGGNFDNRAANRIRAAAHAFEGKCFVAVVAGCIDAQTREIMAQGDSSAAAILEATPKAETFFLDPTGTLIGEAIDEEGIAYAEIDLDRCVEPKRFHDVSAGYNRFDIFELHIRRQRLAPACFRDIVSQQKEPSFSLPSAENLPNLAVE